jgi:hypothetical protein
METSPHPAATEHLPGFITAPGQTDVLMVILVGVLAASVLGFGVFFFRLHSLPEHIAHKSQKMQAEIVSVLCLISLFTHEHIFWIAGLVLALIELPDFGSPLNRIAGSAEKLAGFAPGEGDVAVPRDPLARAHAHDEPAKELAKEVAKEAAQPTEDRPDNEARRPGAVALPTLRPEPVAPKPRERIHA